MNLLRWLTFFLGSPCCDFHSPALLDLFISIDARICLQWLSFHWEILIIIFSQFPVTFHQICSGKPHFIMLAHDYSCADWDGLCDHLRDAPRKF